ncbi:MAG: alpha/beta fold hydrolase [Pseudomonadota bacterium]
MARRWSGQRADSITVGLIAALVLALSPTAPVRADTAELCAPVASAYTPAEERSVSIETPDGRIAGTIAAPQGRPRALALLLHGYTGSRNEIPVARGEGMFTRTARHFAEQGIATLRIDFLGSGKSDGEWADTRFSGQARDATRAAAWLRAQYAEAGLPLGVLGYSQGGLVALRAAALSNPFDRLALWNPVMDPLATYGIIFGEDTIRAAALLDRPTTADDVAPGTKLRPGFFSELLASDPIGDAANSTSPVLVVTGRRDPLVVDGVSLANRWAAGREARTRILDVDAGHDLGAISNPPQLDHVIGCTAAFLLGTGGQPDPTE